ncbi:DUF3238 domain-containing protein [Domibacillus indicus]|uniref:DUF3238 domain-containing protein n=1 Tax=Domibacillus indicus TaxID=1437523 RepID=UPI0038B3F4FF
MSYTLYVTMYTNGSVPVKEKYDGYPSYEICKRVDGGPLKTVCRFTQQTTSSLPYSEEHSVNKTVS